MSLKEKIKGILEKMPVGFQNQIYLTTTKLNRNKIIKKWENDGKPIPTPSIIKQTIIESIQQKYQCNTLVETGTYLGDMLISQKDNFSKIYSIELSESLWFNAVKRLKGYKNIEILKGDSGKVLHDVIPRLKSKAIFWLDGHYSAGNTAKGDLECPIYEELNAIFMGKITDHILLIDDARLFNGTNDYPLFSDLKNYILLKNPNYQIEIRNDIIQCIVKDA